MEIELILSTEFKLDKSQIIKAGSIINTVLGKNVVGGKGKKICTIAKDGDGFHYTFIFQCVNSEEKCDLLANELYNQLDFDFELQVECDIDEDYLEPCDDDTGVMLIDDEESVKHSKWVSECISEGWSFGHDYSATKKTSPFLKPYHMLSETQHKILIKSKNKHGKYCVDEDIMAECYNGVK